MITARDAFEISSKMRLGNSYITDDIAKASYQGDLQTVLPELLTTHQIKYLKALGYKVVDDLMNYQTTIMWDKPV